MSRASRNDCTDSLLTNTGRYWIRPQTIWHAPCLACSYQAVTIIADKCHKLVRTEGLAAVGRITYSVDRRSRMVAVCSHKSAIEGLTLSIYQPVRSRLRRAVLKQYCFPFQYTDALQQQLSEIHKTKELTQTLSTRLKASLASKTQD